MHLEKIMSYSKKDALDAITKLFNLILDLKKEFPELKFTIKNYFYCDIKIPGKKSFAMAVNVWNANCDPIPIVETCGPFIGMNYRDSEIRSYFPIDEFIHAIKEDFA